MIRAEISARYLKHKDVIEKIQKAEKELNRVEMEAKKQAAAKKPK